MKRVSIHMWLTLIFVSSILGIILVACGSNQPIQIGFIGSITGRLADMGMSARNAVQLAVEQCNEQGGIRGRRVTLIIKDDRQDAETALQAIQELIAANVVAVVGPLVSNMATVVVPHLNEAQLLTVAPTVTTPHLSGQDDYFFRVCIASQEHAFRSARYQIESGDMRRVAVVYDGGNRTFSENWLANFKKPFVAGGGKILTFIEYKEKDGRSFSDIARELLAAEPDGILIIANPMDSGLLCQQIRQADASIKITLSNWGASQRLLEMGGNAVEGVTLPIAFDWDSPSPPYLTFRKKYLERYQREPGFAGVYAYDAAQVVLTALKASELQKPLKAVLLSIGEFDGLQGKIRFDAYGDVAPAHASIRIVRNRKFVVVE
ncbi:ABC transporter substrate-binding protein [Desulfosarcina widdelii]|uniref:ABC transporter substrate-binding protein n=1 Tax=Desulfosarcina widdelii TaxID=947919 RepID=A0A5K7Z3X8_9BACT|nr:ABC transporter substrate-binding protein [Desulfosarcina widdelii]BBO75390.1 ABC transporter substrate-binding protein [Desulfosarcina widdelii]